MDPKNSIEAAFNDRDFTPRKKPEATDFDPGTQAKLDVLASRIANGEELWHEDDSNSEPLGILDWTTGSHSHQIVSTNPTNRLGQRPNA